MSAPRDDQFTPQTNRKVTLDQPSKRVRRSATTRDPIRARHKATTSRGLRVRDLYRGYMATLQPGNTLHEAAALEAAELKVACEDARARLLAGDAEAEEGLTRLQNAARRAVEDIEAIRPEKPKGSMLARRIAQIKEQQ